MSEVIKTCKVCNITKVSNHYKPEYCYRCKTTFEYKPQHIGKK